jgi:hypothetical protein
MNFITSRAVKLTLGALVAVAALHSSLNAAAIGIGSTGGVITYGTDGYDGTTVWPATIDNANQLIFQATMSGFGAVIPETSTFAYFTDASNVIRDVLYIDFSDDGSISTLNFDYLAHGNFGSVDAPTGSITDPRTGNVISLASLPHVTAATEYATLNTPGGYTVNSTLRDASSGAATGLTPYLALYMSAASTPLSAAVPEPVTFFLLPAGVTFIGLVRRKRKNK